MQTTVADWAALAAQHQALGTRTRLRRRAASRHRPWPTPNAAAGLAGRRLPRRDGLYGTPRRCAARGPAELVPGTLRVIIGAPRLLARRSRATRSAVLADPRTRLRLPLRAGPRLPQGAARAPAAARRTHRRPRSGRFGYRVFTDCAPVMEVDLAAAQRPRLARQTHAAADPRSRLVVLPRRNLHRPAAAAGRARRRPLRHLPALPRRLPDAAPSSRPTSSTRGAASPTSPSN